MSFLSHQLSLLFLNLYWYWIYDIKEMQVLPKINKLFLSTLFIVAVHYDADFKFTKFYDEKEGG